MKSPNQLPDSPITRLPDTRPPSVIGREARLELVFEHRSGRTILTHAYVEPPLRIGQTFDVDGAAYVILVCSAPGVFAGDCLRQHVTVGRGARVLLASQSALQVHPEAPQRGSRAGDHTDAPQPAVVHADYRVAEGGELHCQWDPVIPFAGARLVQRFHLRLAGDSRLYWSDALMTGRVSRGEAWRFESVDHELRFTVDDALRYLERYDVRLKADATAICRREADATTVTIAPAERKPSATWVAGGAHYAGSAIVHHETATTELAERIHRDLNGIGGVTAAVDLVEPSLMIGRLLAACGAPFARARSTLRDVVLDAVFSSPRLVVRR